MHYPTNGLGWLAVDLGDRPMKHIERRPVFHSARASTLSVPEFARESIFSRAKLAVAQFLQRSAASKRSILEYVSRGLAQAVAVPDIGERCPRIGMPREILQVDDVASLLAGGR